MPRRVKLKDASSTTVKVVWVSLTQDCGHEVFQINFKHFDQSDFHTYTCFCQSCGVRTNIQLRQAFESIRSSIDAVLQEDRQKDYQRYEEECSSNYSSLGYRVSECISLARSTNDWKAAREQFQSVQQDFKGKKLKQEQRDDLWSRLNQAFSILKERQDENWRRYEQECNDNYNSLRYRVSDCASVARSTTEWKDGWAKINGVREQLKTSKLKKEQSGELWEEIKRAGEILKERQDYFFRQREEEKHRYEEECNRNYSDMRYRVRDCVDLAGSTTEWKEGWNKINAVKNELKGRKMKKEQSSELWDSIKQASDNLKDRQDRFFREKEEEKRRYQNECESNYNDLKYYVRECESLANYTTDWQEARNKFAETRERFKGKTLSKDQRNALYESLNNAYESLNSRYENVCADNRRRVENALDLASSSVSSTRYATSHDPFNSAKEALQRVREAMSEYKPLKKEDREKIQQELNNCWQMLKSNEQSYFEYRKKNKR